MSKKKTIAEVREEITATEKKIEQGENLIAEKKRQYSKLMRKARTRQLIQRADKNAFNYRTFYSCYS